MKVIRGILESIDYMKNVALIGFMGSGKTTVGKMLSQKTGMPFIDIDQTIEGREGLTISQIFSIHGESYFRQIEGKILKEVLDDKGQIVSTGGGAVLKSDNVRCMRNKAIVVYLKAFPETLYSRVKGSNDRPLLNTKDAKDSFFELFNERSNIYENTAHYIVNADCDDVDLVAQGVYNVLVENGYVL